MAVELDTTTAQEPREVSQRTLNRRLKAAAQQEFAAWDGKIEDDNCVPDAGKYGRDLAPLLRLSLVFMYRDKAQMIEACRGLDAMPCEGGGTMLDALQADIDH
ncbi:MAG TPA: hypothetical protein VKY80_07675, partial [Croceibacterium sp.]|nr:hypothetical protein [Croceibacterium sp.]